VYAQDGAVFSKRIVPLHEVAANSSAPSPDVLRQMRPEQILEALEKGADESAGRASEAARSGAHLQNTFPANNSGVNP